MNPFGFCQTPRNTGSVEDEKFLYGGAVIAIAAVAYFLFRGRK